MSDTGLGMDAETLNRAFEPFFTTKGPVAGTGLGLATVHGIVTQSGGTVRVKSRPAHGTEFVIAFPEATAPNAPAEPRSRITSPRFVQTRHVLLVEDDHAVRTSLARALEDMGHTVRACGGVTEALTAWREQTPPFDLIVSDVMMPEGTGPDLVRKILSTSLSTSRAASPPHRPRVLFVSGYPDDAVSDPLFAGAAFLAKPFTRDDLERRINDVLAAPAPSFQASSAASA